MAFREMLIEIDSPEHSEAVQKKLFELGYEWRWMRDRERCDPYYREQCQAIRCADDGLLMQASCEFYTENYPHLPWVDILAEQQQEAQEPVKPPIGLVPRNIFEDNMRQQRANDILAAMQRYAEASKAVPVEWIDELKEFVC